MSNIVFLGYRIPEMGGFQGNALQDSIQRKIDEVVGTLDPKTDIIYTGLNMGIDHWVAEAAIKHNIPYIAYLAYEGQDKKWFSTTKLLYKKYITGAKEIIYTSRGEFDVKKLIDRDNKMVALADIVFSFFNGNHINLKYAKKLGKDIRDIMPSESDDDHFITL